MNNIIRTLTQSDRLATSSARTILLLFRARAVVVLVTLLCCFVLLVPAFVHPANLSILSKHIAISAVLAIGMTFVVLAGGIDLSVGSIVGLSGMVAGYMLTRQSGVHSTVVALLAAFAVAAVAGIVNGWLVSKVSVAPFIATLGTLYIARGAALLISQGRTFPNLDANSHFSVVGQSFLLGLPTPVWIMVCLFGVAVFVATKTPLGRHIYAVGGNERAARLAGISVDRVKAITYLFSAFCAAIVGVIIASQLEAAHPATGESFELNAIAAVVLGGASLQGGRGTVWGSLLGACVIGVLGDGLIMLGVSEFWQMVIKGVVIILAVAVDQLQTKVQSMLLPFLLRSNDEAGRL